MIIYVLIARYNPWSEKKRPDESLFLCSNDATYVKVYVC